MKSVQQWLKEKFPIDKRVQIINNAYGEELSGDLIIRNFPNLQKISFSGNKKITSLSISNCPQVETIDIYGNEISELNISELINLKDLIFSDNDLKGEFYELSTPGTFVQDSAEIIQGINNGGHDFERVYPSLLVKELWEEKESNTEELDLLRKELQSKKNDVIKINQKLADTEKELTDLRNRFNNLQKEKIKSDERIDLLEKDVRDKETKIQQVSQELSNSGTKTVQLQNEITDLREEKTKIENEWVTPEKYEKLLQEKNKFNKQFREERTKREEKESDLKETIEQNLGETIQTKLQTKKQELNYLKLNNDDKLSLIEELLEKQEDFDNAVFEDVNQKSRTFTRAQEKIQQIKNKLMAKFSRKEIEELCQLQTEISKLEIQQKEWEKKEEQQKENTREEWQWESHTGTPPQTPKINNLVT